MISSKFIWKLILFSCVFLFFNIKMVRSQLPDPESFCSHAKSIKSISEDKRIPNIDYANYDGYDINFYYLNLFAETQSTYLNGFIEIQAKALDNVIDTIYLELTYNLMVDSVFMNQKKVAFKHTSADIFYVLPAETILSDELFTTRIYYHGDAITLEGGRGYNSRNSYQGTRVNWTLSEPFYAKDWWPCKQDLQDKADSVWVFVTTSNKNKVGSNGLLTAVVPLGNEQHRYEWKSNYPIDYYLISIAIAKYMEYSFYSSAENDEPVWMQNYLYPDSNMYKSQKILIDCTKIQMDLLQEKYGSYPFAKEKYGHCITPIAGGMEHQTMTTQNGFNFHLSIHEMGHSWFGNQVTCATWNDIWLNEGFATYTQYLGLEYLAEKPTADAYMSAIQSVVMRKPDGSVYVPDSELEDRDRIFSGRLSYYKGATIIHMIRYLLDDDDLFFHVLQTYQQRFAYQTASTPDFINILEELSGENFSHFFDIWYYGEGYPIYNFVWEQDVTHELKIISKQKSSTLKTPFFKMAYDIKLFFSNGGDSTFRVYQDQEKMEFTIELNQRITGLTPNPMNWNLMDIEGVYSGVCVPGVVKIEPNPCHDKTLIRFANTKNGRKIKLLDASLQQLNEYDASENTIILDMSSHASAIYFLYIVDENKTIIEKIIKY